MKRGFYFIGMISVLMMFVFTFVALAGDEVVSDSSWFAGASRVIRDMEYQASFQEKSMIPGDKGAWHLANRAQDLRLYVHPTVTKIIQRTDLEPGWVLTLGTPNAAGEKLSNENFAVSGEERVISRESLSGLERFTNKEEGIMHEIILRKAPENGDDLIRIGMDLIGDIRPVSSGLSVVFADSKEPVLTYGCIKIEEADGSVSEPELKIIAGEVLIVPSTKDLKYPLKVSSMITSISTIPDKTLSLGQNFSGFGWCVDTAGDVNGDGYSEVIVGAPYYDGGETDEGAAFVYRGSKNGLETIPVWKREGEEAEAHMGWSVATAGDVNGDGYWDVVVGAPDSDDIFGTEDKGSVEVYHGSDMGLGDTAAWARNGSSYKEQFGWCVACAGDVNGDGFSEIIIGVPNYFDEYTEQGAAFVFKGGSEGIVGEEPWWSVSPADQSFARFGHSVACAGDVNADGYDDVIIGAPNYKSGFDYEGSAWVFLGSSDGLSTSQDWFRVSGHEGAKFGYSVASAGDVNGDGHCDIIVGAPGHTGSFTNEVGRAYVFLGYSEGVDLASSWEDSTYSHETDCHFGKSVAGAGDVNGDGYGDIIVGVPDAGTLEKPSVGRAHIYYGSSTGLDSDASWNGSPSQPSPDRKVFYGYSVACAGDVNGDGYSDVIVGAPYEPDTGEVQPLDEGFAYVYHGIAANPSGNSSEIYQSDQASAALGTTLASAGDVNGDGYDDILIAAPFYDNGHTDEGAVWLWNGSPGGPSLSPTWQAEGEEVEVRFGWSLASAGDVNGDGCDDIIIGCPRSNPLYIQAGRAYAWYGSSSGMGDPGTPDNADWVTAGTKDNAIVGSSVAGAGDVNGDGYCDVIVGAPGEITARVFYGSESGIEKIPSWVFTETKAGCGFGWSVAGAGDMNRDGFSDIIIGAPYYSPTGNAADLQKGLARAFYGSPSGINPSTSWMAYGPFQGAQFGYCVSTGGDMNGDGYSEIIVGAPGVAQAHFYHGGPDGPVSLQPGDTVYNVYGDSTSLLGFSVASIGDIDGDGLSDVIIGAPNDNGEGGPDSKRGVVRVLYDYGINGGFKEQKYNGSMDSGYLGWCVSGAGDVNADGYADFLMGSPGYTAEETAEGGAFFYFGNGRSGKSVRPVQLKAVGTEPIAHGCASDSPEDFWLGINCRTPFGRSIINIETELKYLDEVFDGNNLFRVGEWQDTGNSGIFIKQAHSDQNKSRCYHWRIRVLYSPGNIFGLRHSRWITKPRGGWNEMDLRTKPYPWIPGTGMYLY